MKKTIAAMAIAALAAGFTASAQNECKQQCPDAKAKCAKTACDKPCPKAPCPFDGMNLTDAQKQKLKEICTAKCPDAQAKKQAKQQAKAERRMAKQQYRRERLAQIKSVLTPEQYVQFLENNFIMKGNAPKGDRKGGKRGPACNGAPRQCPGAPRANCPNAPQK